MNINKLKNITVFIFLISWMVYLIPWWKGEISRWDHRVGYDSRLSTQIFPESFFEVEKKLANLKQDSRVLYLPVSFCGVVRYLKDPRYTRGVRDIFAIFSPLPGLCSSYDRNLDTVFFLDMLINNLGNGLIPLVRLTNTRFIIVRKNMKMVKQTIKVKEISQRLKDQAERGNIKKYFEDDHILIYEIKYPLAHFYSATDSVFVLGGIDAILLSKYLSFLSEQKVAVGLNKTNNHKVVIFRKPGLNSGTTISYKNILSVNSEIIFNDDNYQSIAIEMAAKKVNNVFYVEKNGIFEVFYPDTFDNEMVNNFGIVIDGLKMLKMRRSKIKQKGGRYLKLGEIFLKKGRHVFSYRDIEFKHSDKSGNIGGKIFLLVAKKSERENYEKMLFDRINKPDVDLAYIFRSRSVAFFIN